MELVRELFATAFLAVIFSFIIAKLVSLVTTQSVSDNVEREALRDANDDQEGVITEELLLHQKFEVESTVTENRTESVGIVAQKIDEFDGKEIVEDEKKKEDEEIVIENEVVEEKSEVVIESDEDWEGIERSELEKVFAEAVKFVDCEEKLGSDVEMELYGLNKVALEGPCREHAPMPLKLSARAKCDGGHWFHCARNAWQKLGNLSPEVAMEQYIAIVSDRAPGWMENKFTGEDNLASSEAADRGAGSSDFCTSSSQSEVVDERDAELKTANKELM